MSGQGVGKAGGAEHGACQREAQDARDIAQFFQAVSLLNAEQIRALLSFMRASGLALPADARHLPVNATRSGAAPAHPESAPASETAAADPCPRC